MVKDALLPGLSDYVQGLQKEGERTQRILKEADTRRKKEARIRVEDAEHLKASPVVNILEIARAELQRHFRKVSLTATDPTISNEKVVDLKMIWDLSHHETQPGRNLWGWSWNEVNVSVERDNKSHIVGYRFNVARDLHQSVRGLPREGITCGLSREEILSAVDSTSTHPVRGFKVSYGGSAYDDSPLNDKRRRTI